MYICAYTLIDVTQKNGYAARHSGMYFEFQHSEFRSKWIAVISRPAQTAQQERPGLQRERDLTTKQKGKMITKTSLNMLDVYFYVDKFVF